MNIERDAIVVGGGVAGLVAAARMAQLGLRPLVLEKNLEESYPCNSRYSGGVFHVCYRDPVATRPDDLLEAIEAANAGKFNRKLALAVSSNAERTMSWLRQEGVRFVKGGPNEFQNRVVSPPRLSEPGLFWRGRGGDVLLRTLAENLSKRGGALERGWCAERIELLPSGGLAVHEVSSGRKRSITAHAVVIADGGFTGDPKLLGRYISPAPEKLVQRGAATACGDGLRMAQSLGAANTEMGAFYGHVLSRQALGNNALWPFPMLDPIAAAGIVVAADGARFTNEGEGGISIANAIARLADPLSAAVVFDQAIWTGVASEGAVPPNPTLIKRGATVIKANGLSELAKLLNFPSNTFCETIASYNSAVVAGRGSDLSPPRRADKTKPAMIERPPFYAIEVCAGVTNAMGGLVIDEFGRVLKPDSQVIPGLYAAGATTGGLEGGPNVGYMGGLSKGAITGLLCAEHIAASLLPTSQKRPV